MEPESSYKFLPLSANCVSQFLQGNIVNHIGTKVRINKSHILAAITFLKAFMSKSISLAYQLCQDTCGQGSAIDN